MLFNTTEVLKLDLGSVQRSFCDGVSADCSWEIGNEVSLNFRRAYIAALLGERWRVHPDSPLALFSRLFSESFGDESCLSLVVMGADEYSSQYGAAVQLSGILLKP